MKKLMLLLLSAFLLLNADLKANTNVVEGLDDFYKHLTNAVKYPEKAKLKELQGNSIILFTLTDGKLSNANIYAELGSGCDVEVLNQILSYTNYKSIKNGKYALNTSFRLEGSNSVIANEHTKIPDGYIELKVMVVGISVSTTANLDVKQETGQSYNNFYIKWREAINESTIRIRTVKNSY